MDFELLDQKKVPVTLLAANGSLEETPTASSNAPANSRPLSAWEINPLTRQVTKSNATLELLASQLRTAKRVALDTETSMADDNAMRVISLAIRQPDGTMSCWVLDMRDIAPAQVADMLAPLYVDAWNANFDEDVLLKVGIVVNRWFDGMLVDSINETGVFGRRWLNLKLATRRYLHLEMEGKGSIQKSYDLVNDLSIDQALYAGSDTVVTLWVCDAIRERSHKANLVDTVVREMGSRPFIANMARRAIALDYHAYISEEVEPTRKRMTETLVEIANLTAPKSVEPDIFDTQLLIKRDAGMELTENEEARLAELEATIPSWAKLKKVTNADGSTKYVPSLTDAGIRDALNQWAPEEVKAFNNGELLGKKQSVDKTTLKLIGGKLATLILSYNALEKISTTYSENMEQYLITVNGEIRMRGRFEQASTDTGRLASNSPNLQNLSKGILKYMRPRNGRVIVYGDLGQAEVRAIMDQAGEQEAIERFASGEDFHQATAAAIYGIDMKALKKSNPGEYKRIRTSIKRTVFGLAYGLRAQSLSIQLTEEGVPTTKQEAQKLLDDFMNAHPAVKKWLEDRDAFVQSIANNPEDIDIDASLRLFELRMLFDSLYRDMKKENGDPSGDELARAHSTPEEVRARIANKTGRQVTDITDEEVEAEYQTRAAELTWAYSYDSSYLLLPSGEIYVPFESRNLGGRRKKFTLPMHFTGQKGSGGFLSKTTQVMCLNRNDEWVSFVQQFAALEGIEVNDPRTMKKGEWTRFRDEVDKAFGGDKGPERKLKLLKAARSAFGQSTLQRDVLKRALRDQITALANQYRNHPIQSIVADVMELAFMKINEHGLPENAFPVISVHDSLGIECDVKDAAAIGRLMKKSMEESLNFFCPVVEALAEVDVRTSLAEPELGGEVIAEIDGTEDEHLAKYLVAA